MTTTMAQKAMALAGALVLNCAPADRFILTFGQALQHNLLE